MILGRRWLSLALAVGASVATPHAALADDAACIAASESEASLQKALKLREALKQAVICADPTCPGEIKAECGERIRKMNAAMPTLIIAAADPQGNDLLDVHVTLDGAPLVDTLDGRALAIDPGSHTLHFEAPGRTPVDKSVVLRESEKDRRLAVVLANVAAGTAMPAATVPESLPPPRTSTWTTRKTLAVVSASVGVVGIGVGSALGAAALSDWSTAKNECNATSCPASTRGAAESSRSSAVGAGTGSTVAFIVGGLGLAGGAVLWFTAPKSESPVTALHLGPLVGVRAGGLSVGGGFQ